MPEKLPIYNLGDFKNSREIYCSRLRPHLEEHKFVNEPHKHGFYVTVLFTKGSGTHSIDFKEYKVKPGTVFTMQPGQMHNWNLSADIRGWVLFHSAALVQSGYFNAISVFPMFSSFKSEPCVKLNKSDMEQLRQLFREIREEMDNDRKFGMERICSLIRLIYIDIARRYTESESIVAPVYLHHFQGFIKLLDELFTTEHSPAVYASRLNITTKHLSRITRESVGKSSGELIAERLVLEAKRKLVHSPGNISEIAVELGFEDVSYFVRFFKKWTGLTPSLFRKEQLQPH